MDSLSILARSAFTRFSAMNKLVMWDFDGPILNSQSDYVQWYKHLCTSQKKPWPFSKDEDVVAILDAYYIDVYNQLGFNWETDRDMINTEYASFFDELSSPMVAGADRQLETLANEGLLQSIVSQKHELHIRSAVQRFDIGKYFRTVHPHPGDEKLLKPNPHLLIEALTQTNTRPENSVFIGDTNSDIRAGKNVARALGSPVKTIAIGWGIGTEKRLMQENPDAFVRNIDDLTGVVLDLLYK